MFPRSFALTKQIHLGKRAHWKLLEREANSRQNGHVALRCLTRHLPRPVGSKTTTCCFYFEYKKKTSRSRKAATSRISTLRFLATTPLSVVLFDLFSLMTACRIYFRLKFKEIMKKKRLTSYAVLQLTRDNFLLSFESFKTELCARFKSNLWKKNNQNNITDGISATYCHLVLQLFQKPSPLFSKRYFMLSQCYTHKDACRIIKIVWHYRNGCGRWLTTLQWTVTAVN